MEQRAVRYGYEDTFAVIAEVRRLREAMAEAHSELFFSHFSEDAIESARDEAERILNEALGASAGS